MRNDEIRRIVASLSRLKKTQPQVFEAVQRLIAVLEADVLRASK